MLIISAETSRVVVDKENCLCVNRDGVPEKMVLKETELP
jgi:hypothetical protein